MTSQTPQNQEDDLARLIAAGLRRIAAPDARFDGRWVLVEVRRQHLYLLDGPNILESWPVSTAATGVDNREGSGGTPAGLHRIGRKLGHGAEPGMIFESRQPTGILWRHSTAQGEPVGADDLILTRILTLDGQEEGVNRGPGIDSRQRYIYIHGTNHEDRIGTPVSGGCVRMTNPDVVTLFDLSLIHISEPTRRH